MDDDRLMRAKQALEENRERLNQNGNPPIFNGSLK
jgi:hypothetical protein